MIITISGAPGSGKSTIAKKLAEKLDWQRYYIGGLRREAAKKRGMTLAEYNKLGETDPSTDLEVDRYQEELGKTHNNIIVEGRTSWHFIPHSLKIYIDVDLKIGAQRIFKELQDDKSRNENNNLHTLDSVIKNLQERIQCDKRRYKKYFKIDVYNTKNYDFILDTSNLNRTQAFKAVYKFVKSQLK